VIGDSVGLGAMVEMEAGDRRIVFGDGANLRFYAHKNSTQIIGPPEVKRDTPSVACGRQLPEVAL